MNERQLYAQIDHWRDKADALAAERDQALAELAEVRSLLEQYLDPENDDPAEFTSVQLVENLAAWGDNGWATAGRGLDRANDVAADLAETRQALRQACTNLGTIRPLDMLREGEDDISIGEAADRWCEQVMEQAAAVVSASPNGNE